MRRRSDAQPFLQRKKLEAAKRHLDGSARSARPNLLQHLSLLGWQHINLTGDDLWTDAAGATGKPTPLRQLASAASAYICARSML